MMRILGFSICPMDFFLFMLFTYSLFIFISMVFIPYIQYSDTDDYI